MKIPKQIQIAGRKINIVINNTLCDEKRVYAEARYTKGEILLQELSEGIKRPSEYVQESLLHEIIHFILWLLAYDDLKNDEKFVSQFSELLYQVIKQIQE